MVGFSLSSVLDLPRASISCFLKAVCSFVLFSPLDPSYRLTILIPSLLKTHHNQPPTAPVITKVLSLVMQGLCRFARPLPY